MFLWVVGIIWPLLGSPPQRVRAACAVLAPLPLGDEVAMVNRATAVFGQIYFLCLAAFMLSNTNVTPIIGRSLFRQQ